MLSSEVIQSALNYAQYSKTLFLMCSVLAIMAMTLAVGREDNILIRLLFVCILAIAVFVFSLALEGISGAFYINLTTEFLAAAVTVVILHEWVMKMVFPFTIITVLAVIVAIEFVTGITQDVLISLSADLLGAFIIFVLAERYRNTHSLSERKDRVRGEKLKMEQEMAVWQALSVYRQEAAQRRGKLEQKLQENPGMWTVSSEDLDMVIEVKGRDEAEISEKLTVLKKRMRIIYQEIMPESDEQGSIYCYVMASTKTDKNGKRKISKPGQ